MTIAKLYKETESDIMKNINVNRVSEYTSEQSSEKSSRWRVIKENNMDMSEFYGVMTELYGFTEEKAVEIMNAFEMYDEKYGETLNDLEKVQFVSKDFKINIFFSNMAALVKNYSSASLQFNSLGNNPSQDAAVRFFNELGVDGEKLKEIVNKQHTMDAKGTRDFAHECAIYSVMANGNFIKSGLNLDDSIDDLVGFKGDIYSGSMNTNDIKSDIAAVNAYNWMTSQEDGNFMNTYMVYNSAVVKGDINESLEFLKYYGDGDPMLGMLHLKLKINRKSFGALYLANEYLNIDAYWGKDEDFNEIIQNTSYEFLDYLSQESGVPII